MMDQRVFDNQYWLTAAQASARLGVRKETLYAYASRRLLRSEPAPSGRGSRYHAADVERLRTRARARKGHGAVASGALLWGEPVLDTGISSIGPEGPRYRGRLATELARTETFESAAALLWEGDGEWSAPPVPAAVLRAVRRAVHPLERLAIALPLLAAMDQERFGLSADEERARARAIVPSMATLVGDDLRPVSAGASVAARLGSALGARGRGAERALDLALVLVADHELNASTFAARIAASTGADLWACLSAALATLSGPRHGGASDRVEALVREVGSPRSARAIVRERARLGLELAGFGHPLYPAGDPRAAPILAAARRVGGARDDVATVLALVDAMEESGRAPPTIDVGLVALRAALDLPPRAAAAIFAVGRTAGWVAHVLEQRAQGTLLRPRARYLG
jgi:citrate synthase